MGNYGHLLNVVRGLVTPAALVFRPSTLPTHSALYLRSFLGSYCSGVKTSGKDFIFKKIFLLVIEHGWVLFICHPSPFFFC